ncbi:hypothetical protein [Parasphingorhabdus sp.]
MLRVLQTSNLAAKVMAARQAAGNGGLARLAHDFCETISARASIISC